MNNIILSIFLFCSTVSVAQEFSDKEYYLIDGFQIDSIDPSEKQLIESSLEAFHAAKSDSDQVKAVMQIVEQSWDDNIWPKYNNWANAFVNKQLQKKQSNKNKKFLKSALAQTLNNKGFAFMMEGEAEKALEIFDQGLSLCKEINDDKGLASNYNNIAGVYEMQGKVEESLDYYEKALVILKKFGMKEQIGATLNNIAAIYDNLGDINVAINYYKEAIEIQEEVGDMHGVSIALNNLGLIYSNQNKIDNALKCYKGSLKILEDNQSDRKGISTTIYNIGELHYSKNEYDTALAYFHRALELHKQINYRQGMASSLRSIGKVYYKLGDDDKALQFMSPAFDLAKELGYPGSISMTAQSLSNVYSAKKKYKKALQLFKLHIQMRDSIKNEKNQKAVAKQQAKFEYEKQKVLDDAEHEKLLAVEQEEKEKQEILTYSTAGGLGLVGIFLLIVFNRLKLTRKQKFIIEKQKEEVEEQKSVVELAHAQLEEKNQEITDSIQYAKRIQSAILPPDKLVKEYLSESFILYKPKDIVAGDFYWMESVGNKVLFAAADCTGHGVPGAMVSVVCNNGLNRSVREHGLTDPGKILSKTREIVVAEFEKSEEEVKDGMDIALCSLEGNQLEYAGAHNPLWIIRNGELLETKANKQPIGQFDNPEPYTTHKIDLQKGDSVYIFSDGYADQFGGEKGKKMKTANFKKLLLSIEQEPMVKQRQLIDEAFENWRGELEQLDDVCVIGFKA